MDTTAADRPSATYDRIGFGYSGIRRPDPRLHALIGQALGDARTVVNVGAGTGSYEPEGVDVTAVDPSQVMLDQHPGTKKVKAGAEALPFADGSFDAAMAIMTVHRPGHPPGQFHLRAAAAVRRGAGDRPAPRRPRLRHLAPPPRRPAGSANHGLRISPAHRGRVVASALNEGRPRPGRGPRWTRSRSGRRARPVRPRPGTGDAPGDPLPRTPVPALPG